MNSEFGHGATACPLASFPNLMLTSQLSPSPPEISNAGHYLGGRIIDFLLWNDVGYTCVAPFPQPVT
jgi:hypothetical protein